MVRVSVVIPILNEADRIERLVECLRAAGPWYEVICVDGGSTDLTRERIGKVGGAIRLLHDPSVRGRARQMNHGASFATGDVLLFLHADCELRPGSSAAVEEAMRIPGVIGGGFVKKYSHETWFLRLYRMLVNGVRTRLLGNLVGTNAMFIRRTEFLNLGGYADIPILEDVLLCDAMKRRGKLQFLRPHVICSSRRYERSGSWKRMWIAWKILTMFRLGRASYERLKSMYQRESS